MKNTKITYSAISYIKAEKLLDPNNERVEAFFSTANKRFFGTYKAQLVKVNWTPTAIKLFNTFECSDGSKVYKEPIYFIDRDKSVAYSEEEFKENL